MLVPTRVGMILKLYTILRNKSLVPTRVGMILYLHLAQNKQLPCPHTRGDDPVKAQKTPVLINLSPHAWG